MAQLPQDYTGDLTDLDGGGFTVVAPGTYKALITQADVAENKNKNGLGLSLSVQIIEGQYKGVTIFDTINIKNPNAIAQKIGTERKARIGIILCGTPNPKDTDLLLNKPMIIETTTEPYQDKIYNKIKQYHPVRGEFKDLVDGKKSTTTPTINYPSTITNGVGGVASYPQNSQQTGAQILGDEIDVPF